MILRIKVIGTIRMGEEVRGEGKPTDDAKVVQGKEEMKLSRGEEKATDDHKYQKRQY